VRGPWGRRKGVLHGKRQYLRTAVMIYPMQYGLCWSRIKVHPHATGARGSNQDMNRSPSRLNTQLHLAVDAFGMPVRVLVTQDTAADCTQASRLIEGTSTPISRSPTKAMIPM